MYKRQFRLNEDDKTEMARQLKVMHEADIIEPSTCPFYNATAVVVWKKDRSKRLVVDLRGINSLVIIPKTVVLPQIEEVIETITAKKLDISPASILRPHFGSLPYPKIHVTTLLLLAKRKKMAL